MELYLQRIVITLVPALWAITCHEVAHGFVADRLGDKTARSLGRLTLNPLKHLDIIGTLAIYFIGIGWAKPVPVVSGNLRRPKTDMVWVAAAGPLANFSLAILSAIALRLFAGIADNAAEDSTLFAFVAPLATMCGFSIFINLVLGFFNLLPVPPLDGGRVAVGFLPLKLSSVLARVEPVGFIVVLALVFLTQFYGKVLLPAVIYVVEVLAGDSSRWAYPIVERFLTKGFFGY
ncbi:site-2 protease family protein [Geomonas oryzisoli]|uniref:Site-2 protease family protein n=1 Tax=Geomonas oryzisoli TaxID=2847992 RepID=A0ABX8JEJ4_9BACT|nr:site-2 protease family protein [Geomonas oryzisoli]QWV95561.1 site-2 protease family protein [Geomonas oryzisoli]